MPDMTLEQEILEIVQRMTPEQQRRALEYARSLSRPRGISGKEFIARTRDISISADDLEAMKQAIEEDCERIDSDEWEFPA